MVIESRGRKREIVSTFFYVSGTAVWALEVIMAVAPVPTKNYRDDLFLLGTSAILLLLSVIVGYWNSRSSDSWRPTRSVMIAFGFQMAVAVLIAYVMFSDRYFR